MLREWQSRQKGLSSPKTDNATHSEESSPDSALPPSTASSESMSATGQGLLKNRRIFLSLVLLFRCLSNDGPEYLQTIFKLRTCDKYNLALALNYINKASQPHSVIIPLIILYM